MGVIDEIKRSQALRVAADLRDMAENLWLVEYRVNVDEAAALLVAAAKLLEGKLTRQLRKENRAA